MKKYTIPNAQCAKKVKKKFKKLTFFHSSPLWHVALKNSIKCFFHFCSLHTSGICQRSKRHFFFENWTTVVLTATQKLKFTNLPIFSANFDPLTLRATPDLNFS